MILAAFALVASPYVEVQAGTSHIILSAPHDGTQRIPGVPDRAGKGVSQFVTVRDTNAGKLARAVAKAYEQRTGKKCHAVIALFTRKQIDANRDPDRAYEHAKAKPHYDAYHDAIRRAKAQIGRTGKRPLLLDIHGQGVRRDLVYRGTRSGKTVKSLSDLLASGGFMRRLEETGIKVTPSHSDKDQKETRFNGGFIVAEHGDAAGDAIQLEFGFDYRRESAIEVTAARIASVLPN